MLTINNFLNATGSRFPKLIQQKQRNNVSLIGGAKLAPLSKDTIAFTSASIQDENRKNKKLAVCKIASNNAVVIQEIMEGILSKHFNGMIYDRYKNPEGIINPIKGRVKTPESVLEKVEKKIEKAFEKKILEVFSPYHEIDIMGHIKDISGTQMTIRDIDTKSQEIIDRLCKMIEKEGLIVDEIENHCPDAKHSYFTDEQLNQLLKCVNKQRKANRMIVLKNYTNSPVSSGYMALHLTFNLQNRSPFMDAQKDLRSYHELQIIGSDVASLKEIEDFCYKLTQGDDIMQGDYVYQPFVQYFYKYYPKPSVKNNKNMQRIRDAFLEYTQKAYEIQRKRKPSEGAENDVTNWAYKYPTIEECGLVGKVPKQLDFNILARLKRDLDDVRKTINYGPEIIDGKEQEIDMKGKITYQDRRAS